jgi:hypothetical protein
MNTSSSSFSEFVGSASTSKPPTRPHLLTNKPILDPAHASYMASAVKAARYYAATAQELPKPTGVVVSLPLGVGPILGSGKVVIDALVTAEIALGDTYEYFRAERFLRHSPIDNPRTCVWFGDINDVSRPSDFEFYGIPAAPLYVPASDSIRFRSAPSTPSAYRKALREAFRVAGDTAYLLEPTDYCALGIRVFGPAPIDLDNVGLFVLDELELLRVANHPTFLLDDILREVRIVYGGETESHSLEFTFQDVRTPTVVSV